MVSKTEQNLIKDETKLIQKVSVKLKNMNSTQIKKIPSIVFVSKSKTIKGEVRAVFYIRQRCLVFLKYVQMEYVPNKRMENYLLSGEGVEVSVSCKKGPPENCMSESSTT